MPPPSRIRRLREGRYGLLSTIVVVGLSLIVIGLLQLQVVQHEHFRDLAKNNRVRMEVTRAPRGAIYDRNGELLADNRPSFTVVFRPFPAESASRASLIHSEWYRQVGRLLEMDSTAIAAQVRQARRTGQSQVLRQHVPFGVVAVVEEAGDEIPGIEVQVEPLRHYPHGTLAAHLLGYAGEINTQELARLVEQGYRPGDLIGRSGLEREYEAALRGADGAEFTVVNAMGQRVSTLSEGPPRLPIPGRDLVLTLDLKVQRALEEAMDGVARGAAVALDPRDGGVLAMVSRPAFDPNEFAVGLSGERWRVLSSGGSNPLLNRATQGTYPPGSTFKIISMLATLRRGVASANSHASPCHGSWVFGGRAFGCWKREGHGSLDFIGAIQHSCDVYFYQWAPRLGLEDMGEAAREMGMGAPTGLDLPQERGGLVPDRDWYANHGRRFRESLLLNLIIGQGELLATPLQLALMSAEVSVGRPLRPHLLREARGGPIAHRPGVSRVGFTAPEAVWTAVRTGLERVVSSGTGTAARVPGVRVAGKTGTAQNPHGEDHALFVCYAPVEAPEISIAIVVENGGHGGSAAAPRAGFVLRRLFVPDSLQGRFEPPPPADTSGVDHGD
jgi:penicillin-binding protein 2